MVTDLVQLVNRMYETHLDVDMIKVSGDGFSSLSGGLSSSQGLYNINWHGHRNDLANEVISE